MAGVYEKLRNAFETNNKKEIQEAIEQADFSQLADAQKATLLSLAAVRNLKSCTKLLVQKGVPVNGLNLQGSTALGCTTYFGSIAMIECLLELGANPNLSDELGETPLIIAASKNRTKAIKILVAAGAQLSLGTAKIYAPLINATWYGHKQAVQTLLKLGADVNAHGMDLRTAISHASERGHVQIVKILADAGADIHFVDDNNQSPLFFAAYNDRFETVKFLVSKGAKIDTLHGGGASPLTQAAFRGSENMAKLLLELGANPIFPNRDGTIPIHFAASKGHVNIIDLLLKEKTDVDQLGLVGDASPLGFAVVGNQMEAAKFLVGSGADVNGTFTNGHCLLYNAVDMTNLSMTRFLLEMGADPNTSCEVDGETPLSCAVNFGIKPLIKCLLDFGARHPAGDSKEFVEQNFLEDADGTFDEKLCKETLEFLVSRPFVLSLRTLCINAVNKEKLQCSPYLLVRPSEGKRKRIYEARINEKNKKQK